VIARKEPGNPRPLRAVPDSGDGHGYTDWEAVYQDNAAWVYRTPASLTNCWSLRPLWIALSMSDARFSGT